MSRIGELLVREKILSLSQLQQAQDEAKKARLCLWRYGEILDGDDEE